MVKPYNDSAELEFYGDANEIMLTSRAHNDIATVKRLKLDGATINIWTSTGTSGERLRIEDAQITSFVPAIVPNATANTHALNRITADGRYPLIGTVQPLDPRLTALAGLNTTLGLVAQTGADTFTKRSVVSGISTITVTNPAGTAGDISLNLSVEEASSNNTDFNVVWETNNILYKTASKLNFNPSTGTLSSTLIKEGGTLLSAKYQPLATALTNIVALATTGVVKRTGANTFSAGALVADDIPAHTNATGATIGQATPTLFGHAMASSATPLVAGTAAIGTDNGKFAREAHVHPAQTTVSGNAGSATILQTTRTINGVNFNGSANITITAAPTAHTHAWADIASGKPTTLAGYGITDAMPLAAISPTYTFGTSAYLISSATSGTVNLDCSTYYGLRLDTQFGVSGSVTVALSNLKTGKYSIFLRLGSGSLTGYTLTLSASGINFYRLHTSTSGSGSFSITGTGWTGISVTDPYVRVTFEVVNTSTAPVIYVDVG